MNIKFLSQMVTDLWTFDRLIGYNGKIQLWPIKSQNDDAVTLFWVCLVVFTRGVHRSDMGFLGPMVSNQCAFSGENPWISIESVYCCCDLERSKWCGWCMLDRSSIDVFTWGVHKSDMGFLGPMVSKQCAFSGENPLISIESVYCCCDLDINQTDVVGICWIGLQ